MKLQYVLNMKTFSLCFLFALFIKPSLTFSETINYYITDTLYVGANGEFNYLESNYLDDFQAENSSISSINSSDVPSLTCGDIGIQTLNFVLNDGGVLIDGELTLTILDTVSPVSILNPNQNITLDVNGNAEVTWNVINASSHDNCNFTEVFSPSSFSCSQLGLQTVYVTLTDESGNSTEDSVQVNIVDFSGPEIQVNTMIAYLDSFGVAKVSVLDFDNGTSDNCNNDFVFTVSDSVFTNTDIGINTVVFTAINGLNESSSVNVSVEVKDTMAPFIIAQNLELPIGSDGTLTVTPSMFNNGTTDNSLVYTLTLDKTFFVCTDVGPHTLYLTATDNYNNQITKAVMLEVVDNIDPIAIAQNITLTLDEAGNALLDPSDLDNGSSDNCNLIFSASKINYNCDDLGSTNIFFTVSDGKGNSASASTIVTVIDNIGPSIQSQNVTLYLNEFGTVTLNPEDLDDNSADNCSEIINFTSSKEVFNCDDLGTNTVLFGIEDEENNTSSMYTSVIIEDNLAPVAILQDISVSLDTNGEYIVSALDLDAGSYDNCSGSLTFTFSDTLLDINDIGDNTITVIISDDNNNSTSGDDIVITINDNMNPELTNPIGDIIAYTQPNFCGTNVVFPIPSFTDNSGSYTLSFSHATGSVFELGETDVSYMAMDPSGNTTVDTFKVIVLDNIPPVVVSSVENYTHNELGIVTWDESQLVFSDNCSDDLTYTINHHSLDTFPIGTTVVSGIVTDEHNNSTTFTFDIVVEDLIDPSFISIPNDFDLYLSGSCEMPVIYDTAIVEDNYSNVVVTYSIPSGTMLSVGEHDLLITATDEDGNSTEHEFTVSVLDTVSPTLVSVQDDIEIGLCNNIINYDLPEVEDNCSIASLTRVTGLPSGSTFPAGEHTIIYLAKDLSGNTTEISFKVTVFESTVPYIPSVRVGCSSFEPFDLANGITNIEFSGNGVESKFFNPALAPMGINTITWEWTDDFGCVKTGSMEVIINETPPMPEIVQIDVLKLSVHNAYNSYQWYRNGVAIPGATYINLDINDGGNYEVICGNESNCFSTSQIYNIGGGVFPSLDLEELKEEGVLIYPNPTTNFVILSTLSKWSDNRITITDLTGRQFPINSTETLNEYQIKLDLNDMPTGIYLLSIETDRGMITKKILKK